MERSIERIKQRLGLALHTEFIPRNRISQRVSHILTISFTNYRHILGRCNFAAKSSYLNIVFLSTKTCLACDVNKPILS